MFKSKDQYAEDTISRLQRCTFILEKVCEYINETITFINPKGFDNEESSSRYAVIRDDIYSVSAYIDQSNSVAPHVVVKIERMMTYHQCHDGIYTCYDYIGHIDHEGTFRAVTSSSRSWTENMNQNKSVYNLWCHLDKDLKKDVKDKFGKFDDDND